MKSKPKKTAKLVRIITGWQGDAALYKLSAPMKTYRGGKTAKFVVVSAVNAMFSGPETFIFAADKYGEVTNFGELDGSFKGELNHEKALVNAGYKLV